MKAKGKLTLICLLLSIVLIPLFYHPPIVSAQTPANYISDGEDALFSGTIEGILQAHSIFQNAQNVHQDDPVINAYLAMTRLLDLGLKEGAGGLTELLAQFGISLTGDDLETLEFVAHVDPR